MNAEPMRAKRYTARYMTKDDRLLRKWQIGLETDDLLSASRDCASRKAFNPRVQHTQVVDHQQDSQVYFVDNQWSAYYDLAYWAGCTNDEATNIADELTNYSSMVNWSADE